MTGKVAAPVYQAKLVPSDSCSLTDNWTRTALPQCTTSTCTQTFSVTGPKCFVAKSDPNANQGSLTCNGCESFLVTPLAEPLKPIALLVGSSTDPVTSQNSLQYVLELGVPADVNGPPIIFFTKTKDATISAGLMQGDWTCGTSDDSTAPTWANDCNPVGFYGTFEAKTAQ
jgi:hypothetical protein